jgi:oxygen-dependent protoporphyrinogen oxidase
MPAPSAHAGPVFYAPADGMGRLAAATAAAATANGAVLRQGVEVRSVSPDGDGWRVDDDRHDAVVLACPAGAAARVLQQAAPDVADALRSIPVADVAMVTLAVPADAWPERLHGLSGYLVPKPVQRLVTAASFGSQKWQHWRSAGTVVLRVSLGRDGLPVLHLDDQQLLESAIEEVGHHLGLTVEPTHARVTRWPGAFPQYRPHHATRVAALQRQLPAALHLAGASYHGIGVPACINSGQRAAAAALGHP